MSIFYIILREIEKGCAVSRRNELAVIVRNSISMAPVYSKLGDYVHITINILTRVLSANDENSNNYKF